MTTSALAVRYRSPIAHKPRLVVTKAAGAAARPLRAVRTQLPSHEHADKHHLLVASKLYKNKRRLEKVEKLEASGVTACKRIREFAWDLGADYGWKYGWKMKASAAIGLNYRTLWNILKGVVTKVDTVTVDRVSKHSGVPISLFYDPEM